MELYSIDSELRFLKTVTNRKIPKLKRLEFLGRVTELTFHHEYTQQAYRRIMNMVQNKNHLLEWGELRTDQALDRNARDLFEDTDVSSAKGPKSMSKLLDDLEIFRKRRMIFELVTNVTDDFDDDKVSPDDILGKIRTEVGRIEANSVEEETVWSFGVEDNSDDIVERALYTPSEKLLKTGFTEYDTRNGGLPSTGVMIMAATTSGGKSAVSMNLEKNIAALNENVSACKATLEMSEEQEAKRVISMVSGIPLKKFKFNNLTEREASKAKADMKAWRDQLKAVGSRFSFTSVKRARTIDQLLAWFVPYAFDVIIIDYISLLEGVDDDNQWRMLSAIARKCKVFSSEHNCLIILLAQLDTETSKLRYSKGIKEHADVMWKWNYADEEVRETHVITIDIDKARDGELFPMPVSEDFSVMRITDPDDEAMELYEEMKASRNTNKRKRQQMSDDQEDKEKERRSSRRKRKRDSDSDDTERSSGRRRSKSNDDMVLV